MFRVEIKYFYSLKPTSVLAWFCCYQGLIRPMQTGAIDEKWLQANKNSPQVFVWAPSGISLSSHPPEGQI
jgi:hypothetical protein